MNACRDVAPERSHGPRKPARPVGGDMRFPLPLPYMRALAFAFHGSIVRALRGLGVDDEDIAHELWSGFAARQPYDPTRMRRADSWVIHVSKSILLNLLQRSRQPIRCPGGRPEVVGLYVGEMGTSAADDASPTGLAAPGSRTLVDAALAADHLLSASFADHQAPRFQLIADELEVDVLVVEHWLAGCTVGEIVEATALPRSVVASQVRTLRAEIGCLDLSW